MLDSSVLLQEETKKQIVHKSDIVTVDRGWIVVYYISTVHIHGYAFYIY